MVKVILIRTYGILSRMYDITLLRRTYDNLSRTYKLLNLLCFAINNCLLI